MCTRILDGETSAGSDTGAGRLRKGSRNSITEGSPGGGKYGMKLRTHGLRN